MKTSLDVKQATSYKSNSQKARVLTESWVLKEVYCPQCGDYLTRYENNKPVADFICKQCTEDFELKSKVGKMSNKVSAGAYSRMVERIISKHRPNFFFLSYEKTEYLVTDFFVVPKYFVIPEVLEQRKPLTERAQRAGWVGANILLSRLPEASRIFYIKDGAELSKVDVMAKWQKTIFLKHLTNTEARGWLIDIMNCIDVLGTRDFTLGELYEFESTLALLHPKNANIKPKIRQQLQILRDKGYLEFTASGRYRLI